MAVVDEVMYGYSDYGSWSDVWLQLLWLMYWSLATVAGVGAVMYSYSGCGW